VIQVIDDGVCQRGAVYLRFGGLVSTNHDGNWSLYDVLDDRSETHDLASELPDMLGRLQAAWNDCAQEIDVAPVNWTTTC
jgi:hypothetical protein